MAGQGIVTRSDMHELDMKSPSRYKNTSIDEKKSLDGKLK